MSILLDETTPVVVQGITNEQAKRDTKYAKQYGTNVVAGVRPGRGGETIHGIHVYDTMGAAVEETGAELAVSYVPPRFSKEAALEAFDAGIDTYLLVTEELPQQDTLELIKEANERGVTLVGPGSNGLTSAGKAKVGGHGGDDPSRVFEPGNVGIVSRSGGLSSELAWLLKRRGIGVSSIVSVGGRPFIGSPIPDVVERFEADDWTDAIVICGEAGTRQEEEVAERLAAGEFTKPIVALVGGEILSHLPKGVSFGHTGAVVGENVGDPINKKQLLREAGATVVETPDDVPESVESVLD